MSLGVTTPESLHNKSDKRLGEGGAQLESGERKYSLTSVRNVGLVGF